MTRLFKFVWGFLILTALLVLTACGGSSGGGGGGAAPTPAAINADNAEELSIAATDAAYEATINQNANPFGISTAPDSTTVAVSQVTTGILEQLRSPVGVTVAGDCGGNFVAPDNPNATSGVITFNNYCTFVPDFGNMIMDGDVRFSYRSPIISLTYTNFTVTFGGETQTLSMSVTINEQTGEISYTSNFVGSGGAQLTVSNFEISGTPSSGITITSGRVTHSEFGYVDISTTSPVVLTGCDNDRPMSGTIVAEGSNGASASITFEGCDSYTWCYDLADGSGPQCGIGTW
ncbi:MAG: hypothetical protein PVH98_10815 [Gammaproteobacteria bacterium]|jgi:hypothetical protein